MLRRQGRGASPFHTICRSSPAFWQPLARPGRSQKEQPLGSNGVMTFCSSHEELLLDTDLDGPKFVGMVEKTLQESHLKEEVDHAFNEA